MRRSDLVKLFCHYCCEELLIDKRERKSFFANFYAWSYESYSDFEQDLDRIKADIKNAGLRNEISELLNCYFSYEQKFDLYIQLFKFLTYSKKYKYAPKLLDFLEVTLLLNRSDYTELKRNYVYGKYYSGTSLNEYASAILAYLMISFSNDSVLDKSELDTCKDLFSGIRNKCPDFPIKSFEFSHSLKFISAPVDELRRMKKDLSQAIMADGVIDEHEIKLVKKISTLINVEDACERTLEKIEPFCALSVLLSDGELTKSEVKWFENFYDLKNIVTTVEEAFWFLSIISKSRSTKNLMADGSYGRKLIGKIWNREKSFFDLANSLYLTFYKCFYRGSEEGFLYMADFMLEESGLQFKTTLEMLSRGEVTREEILLVLNLIFNDRYDLKSLNKYLSQEQMTRIFTALKSSDSPLKYYAVVQALFVDHQLDLKEYEMLWKNFESLNLDSKKLGQVVYDYSLMRSREYSINDYFIYLRKNQQL